MAILIGGNLTEFKASFKLCSGIRGGGGSSVIELIAIFFLVIQNRIFVKLSVDRNALDSARGLSL